MLSRIVKYLLVLTASASIQAQAQGLLDQIPLEALADQRTVREVTFAEMGQPGGYQLSGIFTRARFNSGVRLDESIEKASLKLKLVYPPGMTYEASYLRVLINGQLAGLHQFEENRAGQFHTIEIPLRAELFSDFAEMQIEFLGSPADLGKLACWSSSHPALRVDIDPESSLLLVTRPLSIVDDLAILPAPFFDPRDQRKLEMAVVLEDTSDLPALKAAGVLASWFGAQASYRQASFELLQQVPESRHSVVLSTGSLLPSFMKPEDLKGPAIAIDSKPERPHIKTLYVMGRNSDELYQAILGLVLEGQILSGRMAEIEQVTEPKRRAPYDAPRYVPTDREVAFSELLDYATQLEASAQSPETSLNLRLPPDLFSWAGKNVDLSLKYRYTAPSSWNDSILNIEINGNLLQSHRLPPREEQRQSRFNLNLLGQDDMASEESLLIPAFRVVGSNQLKFSFFFAEEGSRNCNGQPLKARATIDPTSTLDFSDLPHYIRMPDLSAFANGGYPFSIYADMSDTAVILPQAASQADVSSYLNLMGLMGQWTGLPSTHFILTTSANLEPAKSRHWIALGEVSKLDWLEPFSMDMPMMLSTTRRSLGQSQTAKVFDSLWQLDQEDLTPADEGRALIKARGSLGALMGFESPFAPKKAAIVLTGTDPQSFSRTVAALSDYGDLSSIKGSISLIKGETIQSFRVGETYIAGSLPWYLRLRILFVEHPVLIAVAGAMAGLLLAVSLFGWLSGRAGKRVKGR